MPMVNASMYDVYHNWYKSVQPGARPNMVITGSATVSYHSCAWTGAVL